MIRKKQFPSRFSKFEETSKETHNSSQLFNKDCKNLIKVNHKAPNWCKISLTAHIHRDYLCFISHQSNADFHVPTFFLSVCLYLAQIYCLRKSKLLPNCFSLSNNFFYHAETKNTTKIKFDTRQRKNPIPIQPCRRSPRAHSMKSWFALHTYTRIKITFIVRPSRKGWFSP